jgi:hypothetical protein
MMAMTTNSSISVKAALNCEFGARTMQEECHRSSHLVNQYLRPN